MFLRAIQSIDPRNNERIAQERDTPTIAADGVSPSRDKASNSTRRQHDFCRCVVRQRYDFPLHDHRFARHQTKETLFHCHPQLCPGNIFAFCSPAPNEDTPFFSVNPHPSTSTAYASVPRCSSSGNTRRNSSKDESNP